jgi:hypothetical protein
MQKDANNRISRKMAGIVGKQLGTMILICPFWSFASSLRATLDGNKVRLKE